MRADMDKVLVERPRHGGHAARKGRAVRDPDLMRSFIGLRRVAKEAGDFKSLNENLAPLRRFLERQVGRPWNGIHSEMRERINSSNEVQAHILTHVHQFIHTRVERVSPGATARCGLRFQQEGWDGRFQEVLPGDLYVDPDDGIVKRAKVRFRVPAAALPTDDRKDLGLNQLAVRTDGIWYIVDRFPFELLQLTDDEGRPRAVVCVGDRHLHEWTDPVLGPVRAHDAEKLKRVEGLYGPQRLALAKRQMSGRELRRAGLSNDPT